VDSCLFYCSYFILLHLCGRLYPKINLPRRLQPSCNNDGFTDSYSYKYNLGYAGVYMHLLYLIIIYNIYT